MNFNVTGRDPPAPESQMFIETEQTPNPATLKFLPGEIVMASGTADFPQPDAATGKSPLAEGVFEVPGVTGVFLGRDFVTVTKAEAEEWQGLKPRILAAIMMHFKSGQPAVIAGAQEATGNGEEDSEVVSQIKELIDTRVRPAVAQDGGDIVFQGFDEGIVYLTMQGACAGCPSSTATLKMGIENMLKHYIPEVVEVRAAT